MVREELVASLKTALDRGESLQRAMQTLISSGYDTREVQEASTYTNTSILHDLPESNSEDKNPNQDEPELKTLDSGYKQLPTIGVQQNQTQTNTQQLQVPKQNSQPTQREVKKKKIPKIVIFLMVLVGILILGLVFFMAFGEEILAALFGKV